MGQECPPRLSFLLSSEFVRFKEGKSGNLKHVPERISSCVRRELYSTAFHKFSFQHLLIWLSIHAYSSPPGHRGSTRVRVRFVRLRLHVTSEFLLLGSHLLCRLLKNSEHEDLSLSSLSSSLPRSFFVFLLVDLLRSFHQGESRRKEEVGFSFFLFCFLVDHGQKKLARCVVLCGAALLLLLVEGNLRGAQLWLIFFFSLGLPSRLFSEGRVYQRRAEESQERVLQGERRAQENPERAARHRSVHGAHQWQRRHRGQYSWQ